MDETSGQTDAERLRADDLAATEQTTVGDTPGSPTWPITAGGTPPIPPPVGLNWLTVAERFAMDVELLEHEGLIVLAGEYFPAAGVFIDPDAFTVQHVDVGDMALRHGYFIGNITIRDFSEGVPAPLPRSRSGLPVIRAEGGPIIGLFPSSQQAARARSAILQGAVGAGVRSEEGPLGVELRVERPELPGIVATVIATNGGAVISIGNRPVAGARESGPMSTAPAMRAEEADTFRPGTGATSDSEAPAQETGGSEEVLSSE